MSSFPFRQILVASLLVISFWNVAGSIRDSYHWPVLRADEWTVLERNLIHAKAVLEGLPDRHIEYRIEEASNTYDAAFFFRLQNILVPSILEPTATANQYVLVEFWTSRQVKPLPDLILLEDLGYGLGLYRRRS
jgi:hypothetical protein